MVDGEDVIAAGDVVAAGDAGDAVAAEGEVIEHGIGEGF